MDPKIGSRERWKITRLAFERLLRRLDPDPERAAQAFQALHSKLILFFHYNGCKHPDRWADEVMDRIAKRVAEGEAIPEINPFAQGVARMILLEAQREEEREREVAETGARALGEPHDERSLECLERCVGQLLRQNRELILRYYAVRPPHAMRDRLRLAFELGISIEALRVRALRIRKELESCIRRCREGANSVL